MRKLLIIGVALSACAATPAHAMGERTMTGVAIGAGTGAIVAGPIGAVGGGLVGGIIGGPKISRGGKRCWYDRNGHRHCKHY